MKHTVCKVFWGFMLVVLSACSSDFNVSLSSEQQSVDRDGGSVTALLRIDGRERNPVAIEDIELLSIPVTTAEVTELGQNLFQIYFATVSAVTDQTNEFRLEARVLGVGASLRLPFVSGRVEQIQVELLRENVNADEATAPVRVRLLDKNGSAANAAFFEIQSTVGALQSMRQLEEGLYEAVVGGLTDTSKNPVELTVIADDLSAKATLNILVGEIGGFVVDFLTDEFQVNEPVALEVRATDKNGNFRSAFDGSIAWTAADGIGVDVPIFPPDSNGFSGGILKQKISFTKAAVDAVFVVVEETSGATSRFELGDIGKAPVRCIDVRREGLKSRIFTADEGSDTNGVVFNAYLYSISCAELEQLENSGQSILGYSVQGVTPLVILEDVSGRIVGTSELPGVSASDKVGDLKPTSGGYIEVPLYNLTSVGSSPYQLIVTVGAVSFQVQVEVTPGDWTNISIDPIPDVAQATVGLPQTGFFGLYVRARDDYNNIVVTETASVKCNYKSAQNALTEPVSLPDFTLGNVATLFAPPVNEGDETVQCWYGTVDYVSANIRGERTLHTRNALAANPADITSQYVDRYAVILPGQSFDGNRATGTPDPQIAGEPFDVELRAIAGVNTVTFPLFDGQVNLSPLLGSLRTMENGVVRSDSPLSKNFTSGIPLVSQSKVVQSVVLDTAGLQAIWANQGDNLTPPTPGPRSNIGLGLVAAAELLNDPTFAINRSDFIQIRSALFDHFRVSPIPSPQTVGAPFVLQIEAVDEHENVVIGYGGSVDVSDLSGTLDVSRLTLSDGVVRVQATVGKEYLGNRIHVEAGDGAEADSNVFDVRSTGIIDHFLVLPSDGNLLDCAPVVPGDQPPALASLNNVTSGTLFAVRLIAVDKLGKVAPFSWPLAITDDSGTLNISTTKNMANGCLVQDGMYIKKAGASRIVVSFAQPGNDGAGVSSLFDVTPGTPNAILSSLTSTLPVIRDTGTLTGTYTIVDAAGNIVSSVTEAVTITDKQLAIAGGPVTTSPNQGAGVFSLKFDTSGKDNRLVFSVMGTSITGDTSAQFDVIVLPDSFTVTATDGVSAPGPVSAYVPFEVTVIAFKGGLVLPDFTEPVSLTALHNGQLSPGTSGPLSNGGVTTSVTLKTDSTAIQPVIQASYSGPFGTVTGDSDAFSVSATAYTVVGPVPVRVDDLESTNIDFSVVSSVGTQPLAGYNGHVELGFYGTVAVQSPDCSLLVPDTIVTLDPETVSGFSNGAKTQSVQFVITNPGTAITPIYGCVGASLPDSSVVIFSESIIVCGPNVNSTFFPDCP